MLNVCCNVFLTQWGAVCDQDVCVVWDLVPLVQQSLAPWQVEAPTVVPRLPTHTKHIQTDTQRKTDTLVNTTNGVTPVLRHF